MKIKDVLKTGSDYLKKRGIKSSFLDSELILAKVLKKPRIWILANYHSNIRKNVGMKFLKLIRKRGEHYPIAYLLSEKEFYGLTFFVNNILIPRPETELLVDKSLEIIRSHSHTACHSREGGNLYHRSRVKPGMTNILEIGTGSGCIAVAIATKFKNQNSKIKIVATDIDKDALMVAKKNAKFHKVDRQIKFIKSDLLSFCHPERSKGSSERSERSQNSLDSSPSAQNDYNYDLIIANLPYLDKSDIKKELVYEPKKALIGGKKSTDLIERLLIQVPKLKYKPKLVLLEINEKDSKILKNLAKKYLPEYSAKILKDLAGKDRILSLELNYNYH